MLGAKEIMATGLVAIVILGWFVMEATAETRTLTTQLIITVRPEEPQLAQAPQSIQEVYSRGLPVTARERCVSIENPEMTGLLLPRYTITEKL